MAFTKKEDYPSVRKPGVYLEESDERLGLNTSDLEKFSLGNWNSIVRDDKAYFSLGRDNNIVDIINRNSQYQGRPVGIEFISDSSPQSLSSSGTLPFYFVQLAVVTGMPDYVPIYPSPAAGDSPQPQIVRVIPEYYDVSLATFMTFNQLNLPSFVKFQLESIKITNIDMLNINTFDKKNNFFSARRSLRLKHDDYGRNI